MGGGMGNMVHSVMTDHDNPLHVRRQLYPDTPAPQLIDTFSDC